jgi:hypothetical protein
VPVERDGERRRERRPIARDDEEMSHHDEPPFISRGSRAAGTRDPLGVRSILRQRHSGSEYDR